ncbi:MAG: hypothetical protein HQK54_18485 [Oligoflexales bacterium]|nr:hypothetical protein [Oligoflexales bacterium]
MVQVIVGLFLIAFGIWGLFDDWYYVLDFFSGLIPVLMIMVGLCSLALVYIGPKLGLKEEVK